MTVNKEMSDIDARLKKVSEELESIINDYEDNYADYHWDSFTETLANVSAQIYMQRIMCRNAMVRETMYF